jgi:hypothetical protein
MKLSDEQIQIIKERVENSSIKLPTLKDDIIDHLCCVAEIKMEHHMDFDSALKGALQELAPEGLDEIQKETIFLLNSTIIIVMKRIMYLVGLLSSMSFVLGTMFAMMHWPAAGELSIGGFLGFAFLFIPLYTIDYFKTKIHRAMTEKIRLFIGIASAMVMAGAIIFKSLHLQGADFLLVIAAGLFAFGFLPFLFFNMY